MRINLAGLLRQAADAIPANCDRGAYRFALRETADHINMVQDGKATLAEFADLYQLSPREQVQP